MIETHNSVYTLVYKIIIPLLFLQFFGWLEPFFSPLPQRFVRKVLKFKLLYFLNLCTCIQNFYSTLPLQKALVCYLEKLAVSKILDAPLIVSSALIRGTFVNPLGGHFGIFQIQGVILKLGGHFEKKLMDFKKCHNFFQRQLIF